MNKFSRLLLTDDPSQAHRIRRYFMAVGTSLLVLLLMLLLYGQGRLEWTGVVHSAVGMLFFFVLFFVLFRSRLNLKAREPSLTTEQMISGILVLSYAMFYADPEGRGLLLKAFLVTFLFGVFRLGTQELFSLALLSMVAYGMTIAALLRYRPSGLDLQAELLRWGVVSAILLWFALMGGYIGRMRKQLSESKAELELAVLKIHDMAVHDELTGVPNRRYLTERLKEECARSVRTGMTFCVCLADIDFFKQINDTLGHQAGDEVLQTFAHIVAKETRTTDIFGRYGGEEFLLILTHTSLTGAQIRAERLLLSAEKMLFPDLANSVHMTISIGVAEHRPGDPLERTIKRADEALYRSKDAGRNRVEYAAASGGA